MDGKAPWYTLSVSAENEPGNEGHILYMAGHDSMTTTAPNANDNWKT